MSWNESDFVTQADINVYEERITLNQKMRTKLTLEQKKVDFGCDWKIKPLLE